MANELQKHLRGTESSVLSSLVPGEVGIAEDSGVLPWMHSDGVTSKRGVSLERLDDTGAGVSGAALSGVDQTNLTEISGATVQAIIESVDDKFASLAGSTGTLSIGGDSGTGSVILSSQALSVVGTAAEISTSASGQTITIGLPNDVLVSGTLTAGAITLTGALTCDGAIICYSTGRLDVGAGYVDASTADGSPDSVVGKTRVIIEPGSDSTDWYNFTGTDGQIIMVINEDSTYTGFLSNVISGSANYSMHPGFAGFMIYDSTLSGWALSPYGIST